MEKGKRYDVYYKDDSQSRHKELIYVKTELPFIEFYNDVSEKSEFIPASSIIRIQGKNERKKESITK